MPSQVDIVNKALTHLAVRTISSMDEASQAAESATLIYGTVRDDVLREHSWGFATTMTTLPSLSGETVPGWAYLYSYPPTCIRIRKIFQNAGFSYPDSEEYRELVSPISLQRCVASNVTPAYVEYTAQVTDPNQYDPKFVEAFALKLAANLAHVLTGSPDMGTKFTQLYAVAIGEAKRIDAGEFWDANSREESSYLQARG